MGVFRIDLESENLPVDQSFRGWVNVEETGEFYGVVIKNNDETDRIRFISGVYGDNGKKNGKGIAFFELSNQEDKAPVLYVIPDTKKPEKGLWKEYLDSGNYEERGKVKATIKKDSDIKKNLISTQFDRINLDVNFNVECAMAHPVCWNYLREAAH